MSDPLSPMVEDILRQARALTDEGKTPARAVMDPESLVRLRHEAPVHVWTLGPTPEESRVCGLKLVIVADQPGVIVDGA